ncbi:MAG: hypothetical protein M1378_08820 [Bacteroidetes bacterium]|jgi:hypothetical protein|nr:hypothetical protein [Bacteroidota bacterium]
MKLDVMTLTTVDIRRRLFVGNVIGTKSLMTIYAIESCVTVHRDLEHIGIDIQANRLAVALHGQGGVRVAGETIVV